MCYVVFEFTETTATGQLEGKRQFPVDPDHIALGSNLQKDLYRRQKVDALFGHQGCESPESMGLALDIQTDPLGSDLWNLNLHFFQTFKTSRAISLVSMGLIPIAILHL
jgi:hypothetical protein